MVLYKRKEIRFIVSIAVLLFFPLFCNAAATEEPEEEILFITSYNSDTKYTYDNISTFVENRKLLVLFIFQMKETAPCFTTQENN